MLVQNKAKPPGAGGKRAGLRSKSPQARTGGEPRAPDAKSKTLGHFPALLNKSSLSFVSEKNNHYFKKLQQEKFPRQLKKILPQGINDSFFTSKEGPGGLSGLKRSARSAAVRGKAGEKRGLLADLESQVSDIKLSGVGRAPGGTRSGLKGSPAPVDLSEMVSLTRFLYSKKRVSKADSRRSRRLPRSGALESSGASQAPLGREPMRSSGATQRLKSIVWQTRRLGPAESNLALASFENSFRGLRESGAWGAEEPSRGSANGKAGYLAFESRKSLARLGSGSKRSASDWKFDDSSAGERNISESQLSIGDSEHSQPKAGFPGTARPSQGKGETEAQAGDADTKDALDLTETKPETSDSKLVLDLTNVSGQGFSLRKSPEEERKPPGERGFPVEGAKTNFMKSTRVDVGVEGKGEGVLRSTGTAVRDLRGFFKAEAEREKGLRRAKKSQWELPMRTAAELTFKANRVEEAEKGNSGAGERCARIRSQTAEMLECLERKETEMFAAKPSAAPKTGEAPARGDPKGLRSGNTWKLWKRESPESHLGSEEEGKSPPDATKDRKESFSLSIAKSAGKAIGNEPGKPPTPEARPARPSPDLEQLNRSVLESIVDSVLGDDLWREAIKSRPRVTAEAGEPREKGARPGIEVNEIESLNEISMDSEQLSSRKIDLNQFRPPAMGKSEPRESRDYVDLQQFLQSNAETPAKRTSERQTQKLLEDIDRLIGHSPGEALPHGSGQPFAGRPPALPEESNESIYGIRTNINAVIEYCQLLIKYLLENYSEYLSQKFTYIRLCRESKDSLGFTVSPFAKPGAKRGPQGYSRRVFGEVLGARGAEKPRTPNNSPENPEKEARGAQQINLVDSDGERLCWSRKTEKSLVLTEQTYLALENQILSIYENMNINASLFSMQKIYHRCVFDSFNEIMTAFVRQDRLFPLNARDRVIARLTVFAQEDVEYILAKTQRILIDYVRQQCGILKDKEDSLLDSILRTYDLIK